MSGAPYWIHCNICNILLRSQKCDIFLLSCNHMLCKECMKQTDRGTKCPLCKQSIKYIDIKKLPKEQQYRFEPQAWKRFRDRMKTVNFQNTTEINFAKLTYQIKVKAKKAQKMNQELKMRLEAKRTLIKKLTQQRALMQTRLKEIFMRNQKKHPSQKYRDANAFNSLSSSGKSISSVSGFFGEPSDRMMAQKGNEFQADFFGSSSSPMSSFKGLHSNKSMMFDIIGGNHDRSQSTRTPFYV